MNLNREIESHAARLQRVQKTVNFGDIAAASMTGFIDFAAALPADAIVLCADVTATVAFTDGASGTLKADVGIAGATTSFLAAGANNVGSIQRVGTPLGTAAGSFQGAVTPRISFTSNVNLSTLTAGQVVVTVYYYRGDKTTLPARG